MNWLKITEESAKTHKKDDETLSARVNLASFLTRATRSPFLFPISIGRKPLASLNTELNYVKKFCEALSYHFCLSLSKQGA